MTLEGFVICGNWGAHPGGHGEETGIVRGGGGRKGVRERVRVRGRGEEIPEENGGSCTDDSSSIRSDQQLRDHLRMTNENLSADF